MLYIWMNTSSTVRHINKNGLDFRSAVLRRILYLRLPPSLPCGNWSKGFMLYY